MRPGWRPAGPALMAAVTPPSPRAQAHPQPAVTLQAVTLRVALGVSGAKRVGVPPAAFPGSARRGHQWDRQGSGLSRQGCLRGVVGFAPTQLPSASAEPGRPCSSTGAHQAASPAPGPRGPRLHPDIPAPPAGRHLVLLTQQPPDSAPRCGPLLLLPRSRNDPTWEDKARVLCPLQEAIEGACLGQGAAPRLTSQTGKSSSVCQFQSYLRGWRRDPSSLQRRTPSSPPFPGQALAQSGLGHRLVLAGPPEGPPSLTSLFPAIIGPVPLLHGLAGFCLLLKKRAAEDEMVGWHHPLSGHESEQLREPEEAGGAWPVAAHGAAKSPPTWLLNTTSRARRGAGWRSLFTWLSQSAPDTEHDPINKRD